MTSRERPIVAIDGPAGAGKSTVSRGLAKRLGFLLLDTGALYRTVALAARRAGVGWDDEPAVAAVARELVQAGTLELVSVGDEQRVRLAGEDVSEAIRTPEVSRGASQISAHAAVREALLDLQRQLGAAGGVVVEGRDIGTVVFPHAEVKLFLTASLETRAQRRHEELQSRGEDSSLATTLAAVAERDRADTEREVAPLRQAADAVVVDSTGRSIAQVIDEMQHLVQGRRPPRPTSASPAGER